MAKELSEINLDLPDHVIQVDQLTGAAEIHDLLKKLDIDAYAYRIKFKQYTLKIGQSDDNSKVNGERLGRQVGNLPGMGENRKSPNGKEILDAVTAVEERYGLTGKQKVHKRNCTVEIWDVTKIPNDTYKIKHLNSEKAEAILMDQFATLHRKLPAGNIKDTRHVAKAAHIKKQTAEKVFDGGLPTPPKKKKRVVKNASLYPIANALFLEVPPTVKGHDDGN